MVHTFENNYFLVRTKLGYLRYYMVQHISHLYSYTVRQKLQLFGSKNMETLITL